MSQAVEQQNPLPEVNRILLQSTRLQSLMSEGLCTEAELLNMPTSSLEKIAEPKIHSLLRQGNLSFSDIPKIKKGGIYNLHELSDDLLARALPSALDSWLLGDLFFANKYNVVRLLNQQRLAPPDLLPLKSFEDYRMNALSMTLIAMPNKEPALIDRAVHLWRLEANQVFESYPDTIRQFKEDVSVTEHQISVLSDPQLKKAFDLELLTTIDLLLMSEATMNTLSVIEPDHKNASQNFNGSLKKARLKELIQVGVLDEAVVHYLVRQGGISLDEAFYISEDSINILKQQIEEFPLFADELVSLLQSPLKEWLFKNESALAHLTPTLLIRMNDPQVINLYQKEVTPLIASDEIIQAFLDKRFISLAHVTAYSQWPPEGCIGLLNALKNFSLPEQAFLFREMPEKLQLLQTPDFKFAMSLNPIEEPQWLSNDQIKVLSSPEILELIKHKWLSMDEVLQPSSYRLNQARESVVTSGYSLSNPKQYYSVLAEGIRRELKQEHTPRPNQALLNQSQRLKLFENPSTPVEVLIQRIADNDSDLTELDLESSGTASFHLDKLAKALQSNDLVQFLNLSNNAIDDTALISFAKATEHHPSLVNVSIIGIAASQRAIDEAQSILRGRLIFDPNETKPSPSHNKP